MRNIQLALLLISIQFGCATSGSLPIGVENSTANVVNKYDLYGTVNGLPFWGTGVMPKADSYVVRIESRQDVDLITLTTCHREFTAESVIETGWFKPKRAYEYTFRPAPGIEDTSSCLFRIGTYNRDVINQNAHAIIDFATPTETLPAQNICNGFNEATKGVSICQSKIGLIQRIQFPAETTALTPETMPVGSNKDSVCTGKWVDSRTWEYKIVEGECVVAFLEKAAPNRLHRHTVVGYTKVQIRGN